MKTFSLYLNLIIIIYSITNKTIDKAPNINNIILFFQTIQNKGTFT